MGADGRPSCPLIGDTVQVVVGARPSHVIESIFAGKSGVVIEKSGFSQYNIAGGLNSLVLFDQPDRVPSAWFRDDELRRTTDDENSTTPET